jgi:hypothetical protein
MAACAASEGRGGTAGAGSTGSRGTSGAAGSGAAGSDAAGSEGTSGAAGANGYAGMSGSAGASAAGGADGGTAGSGGAGTAGASGAAGGQTGVAGNIGTQDDPGTMGDGTFALPGPYTLPPESMTLMNGATLGQTLGPFKHTTTGTYTGWGNKWIFPYYVYVPSGYQPGHAAALMIFNDGYLYVGINSLTDARFNAPTVMENLIKEGSMPITIGVFIFPGTSDGHQATGGDPSRATEYDTPNDQYGKFLRDEFLPMEILNKYDIVTDPDGWAMAGHSSGGIASIIAGWFYSDRWHKMLTASPSFPNAGGKFPDMFNTAPAKPLRIYHVSGTMDLGGFRAANDKAAMILQGLHYHDRYGQTEDVHYPPHAAMQDFPNALRWLWRGYHTPP